MGVARTRRQVINRAAGSKVPSLVLGLAGVALGIINQSWQLALIGVVIMILPAALVVMYLRLRSRLSDTELDATVETIRPTLRWKAGKDNG